MMLQRIHLGLLLIAMLLFHCALLDAKEKGKTVGVMNKNQNMERYNPFGNGEFINTWLVLGTFANDANDTGFNKDYILEQSVLPLDGDTTAGKVWRYFDDRLFSRNYDNYQDVFSYYKIKLNESIAAKVVYAHIYAFSPESCDCQLRVGADNQAKAWVNGEEVMTSQESGPYRDTLKVNINLVSGWNSLLLKIANQENGRLGFYARICDSEGNGIPGLIYSPNGGKGILDIATKSMNDIASPDMPVAFREWRYVAADSIKHVGQENLGSLMYGARDMMMASPFFFTAQGGNAPYKWSLKSGRLPDGLSLNSEGALAGVVESNALLGEYKFTVETTDLSGAIATRDFTIEVKERPNRWYETDKLVGLIHGPEKLAHEQLPKFADLMKKQNYGLGIVISYNNGDAMYRWPSIYEPDNPLGDVVGKYKEALESAGIKFGMYMGNLIFDNHGGNNGGILMVEDAMRRYNPKALWFDWLSPNVLGYQSLDALFSMIKTINPEIVVVINGVQTLYHGDWDVVCLEGWDAWGENIWELWPQDVSWSNRSVVESWRLIVDPKWSYSKDVQPDWQEYMRVVLSLIGQGSVANLDHSPTLVTGLNEHEKLFDLDDSPIWHCHKKMAAWANPEGLPSLTESYTGVDVGPLDTGAYGYNTINLDRDAIYVHMLKNPFGRIGMPLSKSLELTGLQRKAIEIVCMNTGAPLKFHQVEEKMSIDLAGITADAIDTILKVKLEAPHPVRIPKSFETQVVNIDEPVPAGNLAYYKPARLLSNDGVTELMPSGISAAKFGVDGDPRTVAQGAWEWAWTYQVDLEEIYLLGKIRIIFSELCYATEYKVLVSVDGKKWEEVASDHDAKGGTVEHLFDKLSTRYIRITSLKPDAEGQPGGQMGIAELQAFE